MYRKRLLRNSVYTNEQFLLLNNDILSPKTAQINTISQFAIDTKLG